MLPNPQSEMTNPQPRRKRNSSKINLTISAVFHAAIIVALFFFAAREGMLGKQLKKIRAKKSFTQENLAYTANLTLSQIARIETGKINPTICTVNKIAKTLEVDIKELFDF